MFYCSLIYIFASLILTINMAKNEQDSLKVLNINELPLPIEGCKDLHATVLPLSENPDQPVEKLSRYALKLIRRLLTLADADYTGISYQDREWLEAVLSGTKVEDIARRNNYTSVRVRQRVNAAIEMLCQTIEIWEERQDQTYRIEQLENENRQKDEKIKELNHVIENVKSENDHLNAVLAASLKLKRKHVEKQLLDETASAILEKSLRSLGVPLHLTKIFANNGIHRVIDILRYTDRQLLQLDDVSEQAVTLIKRVLKQYGISLNSYVQKSPDDDKYYIYTSCK